MNQNLTNALKTVKNQLKAAFLPHQVNFQGIEQKILAAEAPRPDMNSGFWQLVVDQDVSLIVMITKLVENGKRKANQYWPNEKNPAMELEHGIKVNFEDEEVLDGIHKRILTVTSKGCNLKTY